MTEVAKLLDANAGYAAALREDLDLLANTDYLSPIKVIAGFVYDVESGRLDDVVRWERPGS